MRRETAAPRRGQGGGLRGEKIEDLRDPTMGRLEDKMDEVSAEGD